MRLGTPARSAAEHAGQPSTRSLFRAADDLETMLDPAGVVQAHAEVDITAQDQGQSARQLSEPAMSEDGELADDWRQDQQVDDRRRQAQGTLPGDNGAEKGQDGNTEQVSAGCLSRVSRRMRLKRMLTCAATAEKPSGASCLAFSSTRLQTELMNNESTGCVGERERSR